jgi:large subunit ribosomal protein L17
MRHQVSKIKLSRPKKESLAILRNLVRSLILKGKIKTTNNRAKAVKRIVDPLVIKAKKGTVACHRQILKFLPDKKLVEKFSKEVIPKFGERKSGFTRIIKLGQRKGDGAEMAQVEWVNQASEEKNPKSETKIKISNRKTQMSNPNVKSSNL